MIRRINLVFTFSFSLLVAVDMTWNEYHWLGSGRMVMDDTQRQIRTSSLEIKRTSRELIRILP